MSYEVVQIRATLGNNKGAITQYRRNSSACIYCMRFQGHKGSIDSPFCQGEVEDIDKFKFLAVPERVFILSACYTALN